MQAGLVLIVFVVWLFANKRFSDWMELATKGDIPTMKPGGGDFSGDTGASGSWENILKDVIP